jgi:hypothetical protein
MSDSIAGEELLRNVPLGHFDADAEEPTPAVLWPRPDDKGQLSTDRETVWTAADSFRFRTEVLNLKSRGVISIAADELAKRWQVPTRTDPLVQGIDGAVADNPAHATSDFTHLTSRLPNEQKKVRESMLELAMERGWVHGPILR